MSRRRTLELLAFSLLCVSVVPRMADRGMFLDGVTYAAIARNLAIGEGRFWQPHYTRTVYPEFHEQPPLGIAAEAVLFRVLGDHPIVERVYAFVIGVACLALIMWVWRKAGAEAELQGLPVLFWIITPLVSWCLVNNMLENTQTAFALVAVGSAVAALTAPRLLGRGLWGVLSGGAVVASVLVKGPVGFFPLSVPWSFGLTRLLWGRGPGAATAVAATALSQMLIVCTLAAALFLHDSSRASLRAYADQQLIPTVEGSRETSDSRWRFAAKLAGDLAPMAVLAVVPLWVAWRRGLVAVTPDDRALATAWVLAGLAASVPLLISPKQSGHYLLPSIPMFALAAAAFVGPTVRAVLAESKAAWRITRSVAVLLLIAAVSLPSMNWTGEARDAARLDDLDRIFAVVPAGATLHVCAAASQDWGLHAYAQRHWRASLDANPGYRWALVPRTSGCTAPPGCDRVAVATQTMDLYECVAPAIPGR